MTAHFQWQGAQLLLHCHIQPGAKRDEVAGLHGERLKIRLAAPPVDGKANQALIDFVARAFAVNKQAVQILRGHSSRQKTLQVEAPHCLPADFILSRRGTGTD